MRSGRSLGSCALHLFRSRVFSLLLCGFSESSSPAPVSSRLGTIWDPVAETPTPPEFLVCVLVWAAKDRCTLAPCPPAPRFPCVAHGTQEVWQGHAPAERACIPTGTAPTLGPRVLGRNSSDLIRTPPPRRGVRPLAGPRWAPQPGVHRRTARLRQAARRSCTPLPGPR